jgi:hypothetical protein
MSTCIYPYYNTILASCLFNNASMRSFFFPFGVMPKLDPQPFDFFFKEKIEKKKKRQPQSNSTNSSILGKSAGTITKIYCHIRG